MKKVKFIEISSQLKGFGLGKGVKSEFIGIQEKIEEMIKNGWNYQGYIPLETRGTGEISKLSLIFVIEK